MFETIKEYNLDFQVINKCRICRWTSYIPRYGLGIEPLLKLQEINLKVCPWCGRNTVLKTVQPIVRKRSTGIWPFRKSVISVVGYVYKLKMKVNNEETKQTPSDGTNSSTNLRRKRFNNR